MLCSASAPTRSQMHEPILLKKPRSYGAFSFLAVLFPSAFPCGFFTVCPLREQPPWRWRAAGLCHHDFPRLDASCAAALRARKGHPFGGRGRGPPGGRAAYAQSVAPRPGPVAGRNHRAPRAGPKQLPSCSKAAFKAVGRLLIIASDISSPVFGARHAQQQ